MKKDTQIKEYLVFMLKCIIIHAVTYFGAGIIFSILLNYKEIFQIEIIRDYMKSPGSVEILLGPFLQPLRGILFSIALWPLRKPILEKKFGWLVIWLLIFILGIINTPAASPASIEGVIYSKLPLWYHLLGLPEVMLQTLAFSILLFFWDKSRFLKLQGLEKPRKILPESLKVISQSLILSAFGYIGYAVSAIIGLLLSGNSIDPARMTAAWTLEQQAIFIIPFIFNAGLSFIIGFNRRHFRIPLPLLLIGFFLVDSIVPFIYSLLFYPASMGIPFALLLGSIPGCILAFGSYLIFYKDSQKD